MRSAFFFRRIMLLALLSAASAESAEVPPATDLAAAGNIAAGRQVPIVLFYSADYCLRCEAVKAEFLGFMAVGDAYRERALFREIRTDSGATLVGFDNRPTTHDHFARQRNIRLVPTLEFVDDHGRALAEPLVGATIPDYYAAYVNRGIDRALLQLRQGSAR
ncbi:MAG: hypothetical protein V1245_06360 [Arenicellales bacterium]|jgi:hypothetical protein|nr:thioredoxin family protein [Arenicellales bacterium]HCV20914.1 hypothetical protein [Gammaproteobacteria bacterium]MDP7118933.1 thioredoxin family protein [Arenicellales bacterium]MDP7192963.1 thioredoxin family protein [Arenicellales bacterium]MEE1559013.1 hypothetical protein [Arenicellales bacterium]